MPNEERGDFEMIKLLLGGSPCTFWSIAKKNNRETTPTGLGWELFKNYLIAKQKFQPDYFLYENNVSAAEPIKQKIREELEVNDGTFFTMGNKNEYIEINSALVSAQNRQRFYVHNCGKVKQPEDRHIYLKDILENGESLCYPINMTKDGKAQTIKAQYNANSVQNFCCYFSTYGASGVATRATEKEKREKGKEENAIEKVYYVKDGFITIKSKQYPIKLPDGFYRIRKLTVTECERLQTLPDGYTDQGVSKSQRYKSIGNGWTAEVIIHILNNALKNIPKNEKILVLSMYDGIATGRYCLDKMGFTNIEYHAYEIDKYAIKISNGNYPDIIQHGDAFQVKNNFIKF